jgi:hypothetical protein
MAHPPSPPGPSFVGGALAALPPTSAIVIQDPKTKAPMVLESRSAPTYSLPRLSNAADPNQRPLAPRTALVLDNPPKRPLAPPPPVSPLALPIMARNNPARARLALLATMYATSAIAAPRLERDVDRVARIRAERRAKGAK